MWHKNSVYFTLNVISPWLRRLRNTITLMAFHLEIHLYYPLAKLTACQVFIRAKWTNPANLFEHYFILKVTYRYRGCYTYMQIYLLDVHYYYWDKPHARINIPEKMWTFFSEMYRETPIDFSFISLIAPVVLSKILAIYHSFFQVKIWEKS